MFFCCTERGNKKEEKSKYPMENLNNSGDLKVEKKEKNFKDKNIDII